jgi:hypothetical protein
MLHQAFLHRIAGGNILYGIEQKKAKRRKPWRIEKDWSDFMTRLQGEMNKIS